MKNNNKTMMTFFSAGMELCWLYSWINFVMSPLIHKTFPLPDIIIIFFLSSWSAALFKGRGWRILPVSCIILPGVFLAASRIIYISFKETISFWNIKWIFNLGHKNFAAVEYLTLFLAVFCAITLCACGYLFIKREPDFYSAGKRFDFGIYAFLILFIFKMIIYGNGFYLYDSMQEYTVVSFVFFGISSIGLGRFGTGNRKEFLSGYKSMGILFSFILIVILLSGGIIFLFKPYLTTAANVSINAIKSGGKTSVLTFIKIIRFLFSGNRNDYNKNTGTSGIKNLIHGKTGGNSWWELIIDHLMKLGLFGISGLALLFFLVIILWYLFKWLFSGSKIPSKKESKNRYFMFLEMLFALIKYFLNFFSGLKKKALNAGQLYFKLLKWGNLNGIFFNGNETAIEYGLRLKKYFPFLSDEIDKIINLFNLETYGDFKTVKEEFYKAKKAYRRLKSPLFWHLRIRMFLFHKEI